MRIRSVELLLEWVFAAFCRPYVDHVDGVKGLQERGLTDLSIRVVHQSAIDIYRRSNVGHSVGGEPVKVGVRRCYVGDGQERPCNAFHVVGCLNSEAVATLAVSGVK